MRVPQQSTATDQRPKCMDSTNGTVGDEPMYVRDDSELKSCAPAHATLLLLLLPASTSSSSRQRASRRMERSVMANAQRHAVACACGLS